MNIERHEGRNHRSWIAVVAIVAGLHPVSLEGQAGKPLTLWLPYASGLSAACGQGALSSGTHRGLHAWDFILAEGEPIVAAAPGRVIHVTNNRRTTGSNDFDLANHIFVDVGDGRFVTYTHHKAGTARVKPGDVVVAGTRLADVGRTGTILPHIHFDVRGPSWYQSHPARFRVGTQEAVEVVVGRAYRSVTPTTYRANRRFDDSVLKGDEFSENGVELEPGPPMFRIPLDEEVVFRGRVLEEATLVWFQVWRDGRKSDYAVSTVPEEDGSFSLSVKIPARARAATWYRIMITPKRGSTPSPAILPVMVG
jgi:hypothetical protein